MLSQDHVTLIFLHEMVVKIVKIVYLRCIFLYKMVIKIVKIVYICCEIKRFIHKI